MGKSTIIIKGLEKFGQFGKALAAARRAALADAVNRLAARAMKDADKAVRAKYAFKKKTVFKKAMRLKKAKRNVKNPTATIKVLSNIPIDVASYKHTVSKSKGVSVQFRVDKPKIRIAKAFRRRPKGVLEIFIRSTQAPFTYASGYRARGGRFAGTRRDKIVKPVGPSPNKMMLDVGIDAIRDNMDMVKFGSDLEKRMLNELKRKGF